MMRGKIIHANAIASPHHYEKQIWPSGLLEDNKTAHPRTFILIAAWCSRQTGSWLIRPSASTTCYDGAVVPAAKGATYDRPFPVVLQQPEDRQDGGAMRCGFLHGPK